METVEESNESRALFSGAFGPAPWALVAMGLVSVIVGLAMVFIGAEKSGVTTDEPLHVKRLQAFYTDGLYVLNSERMLAKPGTIPNSAYVYGPATARLMHAANVHVRNELEPDPKAKVQKPEVVSWHAKAFVVRHLTIAWISVFATLAVFGLGWMLLGSWRWGVVAAGALMALPSWTGNAMFNMKDSPVGTGYTVMTFALVAMVMSGKREGPVRIALWVASALAMVPGIALMMGTRPGMWPAVVAAVTALLVILAVGRALHWQMVAALFGGLLISFLELRHIYPRIFGHPITMLELSATSSAEFPHSAAPGRGYVFAHTLIEWPIFLMLFMFVGTVVAVALCWKLLFPDAHRSAALAIVGSQAFALPVAAILTDANLYHGLRQLLFAFPAQAVLVTIGIAAVIGVVPTVRGRVVVSVVAILALALPLAVQARLFPYQYSYGNAGAELAGAYISNDYFRSSFREYIDDVPSSMKTRCLHWHATHLAYKRGHDCRNQWGSIKPFWLDHWGHARLDPDSPHFYLVARYEAGVPDNCKVIKKVTRMRNFSRVTMSTLSDCTYTVAH